ncbi:hypothetical protein ACJIZ3_006024 [Penstemon smallii]|uniref:Uncharacterized protein n=1 Tax=Penstemon smallii TaxID=265156 RepID=A0ABD3S6K7_9LAMI
MQSVYTMRIFMSPKLLIWWACGSSGIKFPGLAHVANPNPMADHAPVASLFDLNEDVPEALADNAPVAVPVPFDLNEDNVFRKSLTWTDIGELNVPIRSYEGYYASTKRMRIIEGWPGICKSNGFEVGSYLSLFKVDENEFWCWI